MGFLGSIGSIVGGIIGGGGGGAAAGGATSVNVLSMPCPTVSDAGLTAAWTWSKAGAMLIAAASAKASYDTAKDRYKIAKRYQRLATQEWDFFYSAYRPIERKELAEIKKEKEHIVEYVRAIRGHLSAIDPVFSNMDAQRLELGSKFCVCPDAGMMTQLEVAKSAVTGDLENFARKYAETWVDEKNDIRFARRVAAANRGRSLLADSTSLASKASSVYGEYADGMTSVAQGAAQFMGYIDKRRPTQYPDRPNNRIDQYPQTMKPSPVSAEFDWSQEDANFIVTPNISPIIDSDVGRGGFGEPSIQQ